MKLLLRSIAALFIRLLLRPLCILPIKKNRVLFVSYRGKQYSCNPRAISEELMRLAGNKLEIGWAFHDAQKFEYLKQSGIKVLNDKTFEYLKFALTARVVCTNTYYKPYIPRRHSQFYLRTWHGGGAYKRVGRVRKMPLTQRFHIFLQQQGASLYLSSSNAFTSLTIRDALNFKGEVLEKGMPRNDIMLNPQKMSIVAQIVRNSLGLKEDEKLALYAPTYREGSSITSYGLDFEMLASALSKRFGSSWRVAFRGHHVVSDSPKLDGLFDLTDYPDMQDLLAAADVLITDYSSSIWDMSLSFKPVFLYATDLDDYSRANDFFTDIHSWGFPLAQTNDELKQLIEGFDEAVYSQNMVNHHAALGNAETGRASYYAAQRIMRECGVNEAKEE